MKALKNYIGDVEALEILYSWGEWALPLIGMETVHVPSIVSKEPIQILGQDEQGYYLQILSEEYQDF